MVTVICPWVCVCIFMQTHGQSACNTTWTMIGAGPGHSTVTWDCCHRYLHLLVWRNFSAVVLNFNLQERGGQKHTSCHMSVKRCAVWKYAERTTSVSEARPMESQLAWPDHCCDNHNNESVYLRDLTSGLLWGVKLFISSVTVFMLQNHLQSGVCLWLRKQDTPQTRQRSKFWYATKHYQCLMIFLTQMRPIIYKMACFFNYTWNRLRS